MEFGYVIHADSNQQLSIDASKVGDCASQFRLLLPGQEDLVGEPSLLKCIGGVSGVRLQQTRDRVDSDRMESVGRFWPNRWRIDQIVMGRQARSRLIYGGFSIGLTMFPELFCALFFRRRNAELGSRTSHALSPQSLLADPQDFCCVC